MLSLAALAASSRTGCSLFPSFIFFLTMPCGLWDLSSPTRDGTDTGKAWGLNHWTSRESQNRLLTASQGCLFCALAHAARSLPPWRFPLSVPALPSKLHECLCFSCLMRSFPHLSKACPSFKLHFKSFFFQKAFPDCFSSHLLLISLMPDHKEAVHHGSESPAWTRPWG